jgi:uncharacterized membrane protein YqjE
MSPRHQAGEPGLVHNVLGLVNTLVEFVVIRAALFAHESKTALYRFLTVIAAVIAALLFLTLGYFFLLVSVVVAIAHLVGVSWIWVALAGALVHFILAVICLVVARAWLHPLPYAELRKELSRDREWLRNLEQTSEPRP